MIMPDILLHYDSLSMVAILTYAKSAANHFIHLLMFFPKSINTYGNNHDKLK